MKSPGEFSPGRAAREGRPAFGVPPGRAGGCGSPAIMGSPKPEIGGLWFKAADIISYPLSILLPCGAFPGRMGTAQSRLKIFVVLPQADVEDR